MRRLSSWQISVVVAGGLLLGAILARNASAADNSWTNVPGGKWETAGNWSLGVARRPTCRRIIIECGWCRSRENCLDLQA